MLLRLDLQVQIFMLTVLLFIFFEYAPVIFEVVNVDLRYQVEIIFRFIANTCFTVIYLMIFCLPFYLWNRSILSFKDSGN